MTFEEKCSFIKSGPDDGYNRLAKEVIEEYQRRLGKAAVKVFGATYDRLTWDQQIATIAENVRLGAELAAVRRQLGDDVFVSTPEGVRTTLALDEAVRILQVERSAEADRADECQRDRRESDDLLRRANSLLLDLLGRLSINGINLPTDASAAMEQWTTDSREAINRSLE